MTTDFRCSLAAARRGDSIIGTAPHAPGWLLIERSSGWMPKVSDTLEAEWGEAAAGVLERANELGLRPTLIRRPGRGHGVAGGAVRQWAIADCRAYGVGQSGAANIRWGELRSPQDLLDAMDGFEAGHRGGSDPIYLVCTHARHDVCCAIFGRQTVTELSAAHPDLTWECSHTGGDRFAPNLVVLPAGLVYARADARAAIAAVDAQQRGELLPELLRGNSALPPPAQAAQAFVRGEDRSVHNYEVDVIEQRASDSWIVTVAGRKVVVERSFVITKEPLKCLGSAPGRIARYDCTEVS